MKVNLLIVVILAAAMIAVATGVALAEHGPGGCFGRQPPEFGPGLGYGPGSFDRRMAKILRLTETQQAQIKGILDAEHEQVKPLFDMMLDSRKLLMLAADAAAFEEATVRAIASEQAKIEIELIVSRTRVQSLINALLTTEQRELLKNLRPDGM